MKRSLLLVAMTLVASAASAPAEATLIDIRIEGQTRTIFEGAVETSGHNVRATNEQAGVVRRCDGNAGAPTPTAAAYDALATVGRGFEGDWFDSYGDYLITGFAGESSDNWGLLRNGLATSTGGCQVKLASGDRVVWAAGGPRPPIALQALTSTSATPIGVRATTPEGTPVAGATIYPTGADGQPGPALGSTGADGTVSIAFGSGFQRLKATKAGLTRSNRVVACSTACTTVPPDLVPRTTAPSPAPLGTTTTPLRLSRPVAGTSGYRKGRIAVRWRVLTRGVGQLRFSIGARDLSSSSRRHVTRSRGTTQTSALLNLPAGRTFALRLTSVDRMLNRTTADFGRVIVPIDDRGASVKRAGRWRKARSADAWKGTVLRGRPGARVELRLRRGRTAVLLRARGAATLRVGSERVRVPARKRGSRVVVYGPTRKKTASVAVTVLRGTVDLDGVAASP